MFEVLRSRVKLLLHDSAHIIPEHRNFFGFLIYRILLKDYYRNCIELDLNLVTL